jgi:hypothetical protein
MSTRQDDIASGAGDERMLERTVTIRESRRVVWISAGSALLPALLSLVSVRIVGRTTDASMAMLGFSALIVVIGLCVAGLPGTRRKKGVPCETRAAIAFERSSPEHTMRD